MSVTHSTALVDPAQRLAYWADLVCDTYVQLDCEPHAGQRSIEGRIESGRLSTLALSRVTATPQLVRRTASRIARASEDFFLVSIQTDGEGVVSQDGRDARLRPGDFALYDSTRPYTLRFDGDFQQIVLMLPGPTLRTALRDTDRLTATAVCGERGAGHLMIGMIRSLASTIDTLAPESAAAVADSVTQILVAGLSALPQVRQPVPTARTAFLREQVKAHVRAHLRDPALTVTGISKALRMSISTLHRIWAGEACSLSEWIWTQRLDMARRELSDPLLASRSVSDIAFACGFNDAAHFSRSFRARFGCAPRELRPANRR